MAVNVSADHLAVTLLVSLSDVRDEQRAALTLRLHAVRQPSRGPSLATVRVPHHTGLFDPDTLQEVQEAQQCAGEACSFKGDTLGTPPK